MYKSPPTPDIPWYEKPVIFKERSSWYSFFQRSVKSTPYRITGLLQAQGLHRWCSVSYGPGRPLTAVDFHTSPGCKRGQVLREERRWRRKEQTSTTSLVSILSLMFATYCMCGYKPDRYLLHRQSCHIVGFWVPDHNAISTIKSPVVGANTPC